MHRGQFETKSVSNPSSLPTEPQSLAEFIGKRLGLFYIPRQDQQFGAYASFVCDSLLVLVIAFCHGFGYTCVANQGRRPAANGRDKEPMRADRPGPPHESV